MSAYDDAIEGVPSLPIIADRQRGLARSVGDLLRWRNGRDGIDAWREVTDRRIDSVEGHVESLVRSVDSLRKTLLGLAISISIASITFALSVLISTGKIGGK